MLSMKYIEQESKSNTPMPCYQITSPLMEDRTYLSVVMAFLKCIGNLVLLPPDIKLLIVEATYLMVLVVA